MRREPVEDVRLVRTHFAELKFTDLWGPEVLEVDIRIGGQLSKEG
jgi:hypothetical protein